MDVRGQARPRVAPTVAMSYDNISRSDGCTGGFVPGGSARAWTVGRLLALGFLGALGTLLIVGGSAMCRSGSW